MGGVDPRSRAGEKNVGYSRVEIATELDRGNAHAGGSSMDHGTLSSLELGDQKEGLECYRCHTGVATRAVPNEENKNSQRDVFHTRTTLLEVEKGERVGIGRTCEKVLGD